MGWLVAAPHPLSPLLYYVCSHEVTNMNIHLSNWLGNCLDPGVNFCVQQLIAGLTLLQETQTLCMWLNPSSSIVAGLHFMF